jgi:hypothetical protein
MPGLILTGPGMNGTYLSFFGCPYRAMSALASGLGLVNNGYGFGRCFTARGSIRPGRWPTRRSLISLSNKVGPLVKTKRP